jgi:hypothetical protein
MTGRDTKLYMKALLVLYFTVVYNLLEELYFFCASNTATGAPKSVLSFMKKIVK